MYVYYYHSTPLLTYIPRLSIYTHTNIYLHMYYAHSAFPQTSPLSPCSDWDSNQNYQGRYYVNRGKYGKY